jgi:hypothetical protein
MEGGFMKMHEKHVSDKEYDCSVCHTFTRPERGLNTELASQDDDSSDD